MYVPDEAQWVIVLLVALLGSAATLFDESDIEDPDLPTYMALLIRRPIFAFVAWVFWVIWAGMNYSLNNCDTAFGQCFTNLTEQTTTAPAVSPNSFAGVLGEVGYAMAAVFFILMFFFAVLNGYVVMRHGYLGRLRGPLDKGDRRLQKEVG